MLQIGLLHQVNDRLELYANVNRFGWSAFKDTHITYSNGLAETVVDNQWKVDFGYQFIKFTEVTIALAGGNNVPRGSLNGKLNLYAHIFMTQVNYRF